MTRTFEFLANLKQFEKTMSSLSGASFVEPDRSEIAKEIGKFFTPSELIDKFTILLIKQGYLEGDKATANLEAIAEMEPLVIGLMAGHDLEEAVSNLQMVNHEIFRLIDMVQHSNIVDLSDATIASAARDIQTVNLLRSKVKKSIDAKLGAKNTEIKIFPEEILSK